MSDRKRYSGKKSSNDTRMHFAREVVGYDWINYEVKTKKEKKTHKRRKKGDLRAEFMPEHIPTTTVNTEVVGATVERHSRCHSNIRLVQSRLLPVKRSTKPMRIFEVA